MRGGKKEKLGGYYQNVNDMSLSIWIFHDTF